MYNNPMSKNTITVKIRKPRNPLVRQALFRAAGKFDTGNKRQADKRQLRKMIHDNHA